MQRVLFVAGPGALGIRNTDERLTMDVKEVALDTVYATIGATAFASNQLQV